MDYHPRLNHNLVPPSVAKKFLSHTAGNGLQEYQTYRTVQFRRETPVNCDVHVIFPSQEVPVFGFWKLSPSHISPLEFCQYPILQS